MADQQYCLRWNNHQTTLVSIFDTLLQRDRFTDCTISAEGQSLAAHKILLTACSPYFEAVLSQIRFDRHPVIILKDVTFAELKALMDYMYRGEVNISQDQLAALLNVAESLQIKGLSDSREKEKPEKRPPPLPQPASSVPRSSGLTIVHSRRSNQAQILDLPLDSPLNRQDGNVSPVPRKRKQPRRRSSGDDSSLGQVHPNSMTESLDSSNSRKPIAASIPQNVSALLSKTAVIPETCLHDHDLVLPDALANVDIPKIEPPTELDLLQPKEEYVDDNDGVDHITLDDDDDDMDLSQQAGPSHGGEGSSSQGYPPSWHQASDRSNDEVFMAAQEAVGGAQRDSQGASPVEDAQYLGASLPVVFADMLAQGPFPAAAAEVDPLAIVKVEFTEAIDTAAAVAVKPANVRCTVVPQGEAKSVASADNLSGNTFNNFRATDSSRSSCGDVFTISGGSTPPSEVESDNEDVESDNDGVAVAKLRKKVVSVLSDTDVLVRLRSQTNPINVMAAQYMRLDKVPVVALARLGPKTLAQHDEINRDCKYQDGVNTEDNDQSTGFNQDPPFSNHYTSIRDIASNLVECCYAEVSNQWNPVHSVSYEPSQSPLLSSETHFALPGSHPNNVSSTCTTIAGSVVKRLKRKPFSSPKKKYISILPKPQEDTRNVLPQALSNLQTKSTITLLPNVSSLNGGSNSAIQNNFSLSNVRPMECVPFISNFATHRGGPVDGNSSIKMYSSLPQPVHTDSCTIQNHSNFPEHPPAEWKVSNLVSHHSNQIDMTNSLQNFSVSAQSSDYDNHSASTSAYQPITFSGNNFPALFDFLGKCTLGQGPIVMKRTSATGSSAPGRKYVNILPRPNDAISATTSVTASSSATRDKRSRSRREPLTVRKARRSQNATNRSTNKVVTCVTCAATFGSNFELYSHLVTHLPSVSTSGQ